MLGVVLVSFASTLGAAAAFLIARYFARDIVSRRLSGNEYRHYFCKHPWFATSIQFRHYRSCHTDNQPQLGSSQQYQYISLDGSSAFGSFAGLRNISPTRNIPCCSCFMVPPHGSSYRPGSGCDFRNQVPSCRNPPFNVHQDWNSCSFRSTSYGSTGFRGSIECRCDVQSQQYLYSRQSG